MWGVLSLPVSPAPEVLVERWMRGPGPPSGTSPLRPGILGTATHMRQLVQTHHRGLYSWAAHLFLRLVFSSMSFASVSNFHYLPFVSICLS